MSSERILEFVSKYSLYSDCISFSIGLIGNGLNILIFTNLKCFRINRCGLYLIVESISNFLNQLIYLLLILLTSIYGTNFVSNSLSLCRLKYIMTQLTGFITFSMICLSSVDQYFSTNYRYNFLQICTRKLSVYLIFLNICFSIFHSILFSIFLDINSIQGCIIFNPIWLRYATAFYYPVLMGLLPVVIASSFSLLAFQNVRRLIRRQIPIERRRFDRQITAMVLLRVVFFVIFTIPYDIYRIYTINTIVNPMNSFRYAISRLIQVIFISIFNLNYVVSFYLFMISSSRYRRQVKYVLLKKCWRQWKNCCCIKENQIHPNNTRVSQSNIELE